jgi:colicin import membrane protein
MHRLSLVVLGALSLAVAGCAGTPPPATMPVGEPLPPTRARGPCPSLQVCARILNDVVTSEWKVPPKAAQRGLKATVLVDVKPDGLIRSVKVTQSSGDAAFDRSAVQAVEKSQPFVELRDLREVREQGGMQLQFRFVPK